MSTSARILVVDDDAAIREALSDTLSLEGYTTETAADAHAALSILLSGQHVDLVISDVQMPQVDGLSLLNSVREARIDVPVMLMTAYGSIDQAVTALQSGACDYLSKPLDVPTVLEKVETWVSRVQTVGSTVVSGDERTQELLALACKVASSEVSVMISGPSGAGKEVMARYIHDNSPRANAPFVAINCAAIPENMLEAVLFGYEKGAYTGAHKSMPGKFEQAQNGTLLLDEISEMDLGLQAKLLRVLQEREVERLGSRDTIRLNVRILATTNRTLREEVIAGNFREDLFYRLNVFPIRLLPLAERPGDIEPLAQMFVAKYSGTDNAPKSLSTTAVTRLNQYRWPGNVRELENVIQRALVLVTGQKVCAADIHFEDCAPISSNTSNASAADTGENRSTAAQAQVSGTTLKSRESETIMDILEKFGGSRKATAEELGISPRTLRYKLHAMREQGYKVPEPYGYSTDK